MLQLLHLRLPRSILALLLGATIVVGCNRTNVAPGSTTDDTDAGPVTDDDDDTGRTSPTPAGDDDADDDEDDDSDDDTGPTATPVGDDDADDDEDDDADDDEDDDADDDDTQASVVFAGPTGVNGVSNLYGLTYSTVGSNTDKIYASGTVSGNVALLRFNADGSLDESFGDDGVADSGFAGNSYGVVELAGGDLIVQGNGANQVFLVKFNSSGELDEDFGRAVVFGWDSADLAEIDTACAAAAGAPTNAGLVAACQELWPAATEPAFTQRPAYTSWGVALDKVTTAGVEKIVVFGFGAPAKAASGTQRVDNDRWVTRVFASNGLQDPGFNGGAPFSVDVANLRGADGGRRGIVEPNGSILSVGYTDWGNGPNVVLIRLKPNGTADETFGFSTINEPPGTLQPGLTRFNPFASSGGVAEAYSAVQYGDGQYVTTGYGRSNLFVETVENDLVSFRVNATGLDESWGEDGSVAVQSEIDPDAIALGSWTAPGTHGAAADGRIHRENGRALVALPNGDTLHVGCYNDYASVHLFDADGSPVESFGNGGKIVFDAESDVTHTAPFFAVARSASGRVVTAAQGDFLAIFDLEADESTGDDDDDDEETIVFAGPTGVNGASNLYGLTYATHHSNAGKLYASGTVGGNVALVRFNRDGSLDESFGDDGVADSGFAGNSYGVVELAGGDLIVQGNGAGEVFLVKFNSSGELDEDFGRAVVFGWDSADLDEITAACTAAAGDPENADLALACQELWPGATGPAFAQRPAYTSWGIALDQVTTAGTEKIVVFAFGAPAKAASGEQRADNDRWVTRVFASDGLQDPGFNGGAPYSVDVANLQGADGGRRGIVESNGSIVSVGYTDWGNGPNVVLIRLKPDGTADESFGFSTINEPPGTLQPGLTRFNPFASSGGVAEAYSVVQYGDGQYVTTGYGRSNLFVETVENDLVSFRVNATGLDESWGEAGSVAVQSEIDPDAIALGSWTAPGTHGAAADGRVHRENGRALVLVSEGTTLHVGCYNDYASVHLFDADGSPVESFGNGGKIVFDAESDVTTHTAPFFAAARSADGRVATTAQGDFLAIFNLN